MQNLNLIKEQAINDIENAKDLNLLEQVRAQIFGKKGVITELMKSLSHALPDERPKLGQQINVIKKILIDRLENRASILEQEDLEKKLNSEALDITLPGKKNYLGTVHPINQIREKFIEFFQNLGFTCADGPEIETEYYNFEALNIPKTHPSRAMHDTFYFPDGTLLRTHTSPVQIRALEQTKPPLRIIAPGRVYRCDSDLTHTPMFHQVEGLMIDEESNMGHLKSVLSEFLSFLFEKKIDIRFRPSYFPFTEPSAEFDMQCAVCCGRGCKVCKHTGWLEIGGGGMVHPKVLSYVKLDPDVYQGWAFGMGIDRITMLYFGIPDLRQLFDNELPFLQQF